MLPITRIERTRLKLAKYREQSKRMNDDEIAKQLDCHPQWVRRFASGRLEKPGAELYLKLEDWVRENA